MTYLKRFFGLLDRQRHCRRRRIQILLGHLVRLNQAHDRLGRIYDELDRIQVEIEKLQEAVR